MTINVTIFITTNNYKTENNMQVINPKGCIITETNSGTMIVHMGEETKPAYEEAEYAEEVEDDEGYPLSWEENARIWAKNHFYDIATIYSSSDALAKKAANVCRLYEEEKARHGEGDRWRTSYLKNLFFPNDPNSQWLKNTNMSFEMFSELIRDEKVDKSIFSKAKSKYSFCR